MSDNEKVLRALAIEFLNLPQQPASGYLRDVEALLLKRLLPVLEAGQAMRDRVGAGHYGHYSGDNWDAALRRAAQPDKGAAK